MPDDAIEHQVDAFRSQMQPTQSTDIFGFGITSEDLYRELNQEQTGLSLPLPPTGVAPNGGRESRKRRRAAENAQQSEGFARNRSPDKSTGRLEYLGSKATPRSPLPSNGAVPRNGPAYSSAANSTSNAPYNDHNPTKGFPDDGESLVRPVVLRFSRSAMARTQKIINHPAGHKRLKLESPSRGDGSNTAGQLAAPQPGPSTSDSSPPRPETQREKAKNRKPKRKLRACSQRSDQANTCSALYRYCRKKKIDMFGLPNATQ
ncbi:hypothetical protein CERZMDRAFT_81847 [Cercospora zeae-maydis SCOH1-5]|uniref:Uncharacterized protein n=1 Tax=Cercospora zeae-maydis SCOH1-5 TaxID=717836 RepID=A0A6A6FQI5_9PEZI|nr:hypothetical protein CERZMDRAFT_81847 [Cercospora zeae-maydis SCOH1-5]